MRAALEAAGYHRHKQGAWSRKRMKAEMKPIATPPPPAFPTWPGPISYDAIVELMRRAAAGSQKCLESVRTWAEESPELVARLCSGELARRAEHVAINRVVQSGALDRAGIREKLDAIKADLESGGSSPLERMLVERIALSWLDVYLLEFKHFYDQHTSRPPEVTAAMDRRRTQANGRFLAAIKALAVVRRLGAPAALAKLKPHPGAMAAGHQD